MIKTAIMYGYDDKGITANLLIINGSYFVDNRIYNGYSNNHVKDTTLRIIKL